MVQHEIVFLTWWHLSLYSIRYREINTPCRVDTGEHFLTGWGAMIFRTLIDFVPINELCCGTGNVVCVRVVCQGGFAKKYCYSVLRRLCCIFSLVFFSVTGSNRVTAACGNYIPPIPLMPADSSFPFDQGMQNLNKLWMGQGYTVPVITYSLTLGLSLVYN